MQQTQSLLRADQVATGRSGQAAGTKVQGPRLHAWYAAERRDDRRLKRAVEEGKRPAKMA